MKQIIIISTLILSICLNIKANTFTVTNTNDSGSGSLREAIDFAIFMAGTHTIEFNIPTTDSGYNATTGVWALYPLTTYSYITSGNITIDGSTQTTNQGNTNPLGPEIELGGNDNTIDYAFSVINAPNIHFIDLCVIDFTIGLQIFGPSSINCSITGCYVGIDATSIDTLGNYIGIEIIGGASNITIGGTTATERNIVSGNEHIGIRLVDANNNLIIGNYVGLDRTGMFAMGNYDGVSIEGAASYNIVGGINPGERNVIAGNYAYGVPVFGAGCNYNEIIGNYIGVDVTGNNAIPNTYAILFDDGAAYNIVGGNSPEHRNILSGNSGYGVFIYNMGTHNNLVKGNYIGTDPSGTIAIPNANGIVVDGAPYSNIIDSNLISGNLQQGIIIHITGSDSTLVTRNKIGTDITGTQPLGNGIDGVRIAQGPQHTIIGGSLENANIIAFNISNGVTVMNDNDDFNLISCNSIFSNGGLGIDLYLPGVNSNDSGDGDTGPNQEMNYPEIDSVIYQASETTIYGTLDTQNPETCKIEIFIAQKDPSGFGEGKTYLSATIPNISGFWIDTITVIPEGLFLTTTAIDENNNTSEFSICASSFYPVSSNQISVNNIKIYPNPSNGEFIIEGERIFNVEIIDITGKTIYNVIAPKDFGEATWQSVNLSNQQKGIYFAKITTTNGIVVEKLILE